MHFETTKCLLGSLCGNERERMAQDSWHFFSLRLGNRSTCRVVAERSRLVIPPRAQQQVFLRVCVVE